MLYSRETFSAVICCCRWSCSPPNVDRRKATSKCRQMSQNFAEVNATFLADVVAVVEMEGIPPELILNMDLTGIRLVPAGCWTMKRVGSRRVEVAGVGEKRQITAVLYGSLTCDYLPIQLTVYTREKLTAVILTLISLRTGTLPIHRNIDP